MRQPGFNFDGEDHATILPVGRTVGTEGDPSDQDHDLPRMTLAEAERIIKECQLQKKFGPRYELALREANGWLSGFYEQREERKGCWEALHGAQPRSCQHLK